MKSKPPKGQRAFGVKVEEARNGLFY